MNENQIIQDWLNRASNVNKLPTISYSEEVFNFITATCSCYSFGEDKIYIVNGIYQKIVLKK